jgi:O-antigen/teichoic acid export membrane protein
LSPIVKRFAFVGMFANAVAAQALLSIGNFVVSLILLRFASDAEFGFYVLALNGVMLLISIQTAFVGPAMVLQMTRVEGPERADLIGGLYGGQRRVLPPLACLCLAATCALWLFKVLDSFEALLLCAAVGAAWAALYRQFFRMVLNGYRNSEAVLRGDAVYVAAQIAGAAIAVFSSVPAVVTIAFLGAGATAGGYLNSRLLWKHERWNINSSPAVWRKIARVGAWTAAGSVAHWSFSQGYNYLIVGTLNVAAVAAAGSTRMLMMPVNLLSTGIGTMMLATASGWLLEHGTRSTYHRVMLGAAAVAGVALLYLSILWLTRDFIFTSLLHKDFAQRDLLLILWSMASVTMVVRDQLVNFLLARTRFRSLTMLTMVGAIVSLVVSYVAMLRIGVAGAPVGVLTGEILNVVGLVAMSHAEVRRSAANGDMTS